METHKGEICHQKKKNIKLLFSLCWSGKMKYLIDFHRTNIGFNQNKKDFGFVAINTPSLQKKMFLRSFTDQKRRQNRIKTILLFPLFFFAWNINLVYNVFSNVMAWYFNQAIHFRRKKNTQFFFLFTFLNWHLAILCLTIGCQKHQRRRTVWQFKVLCFLQNRCI